MLTAYSYHDAGNLVACHELGILNGLPDRQGGIVDVNDNAVLEAL